MMIMLMYFYPTPCIEGMYCPNLENLDISGVKVTQTSFKQLTMSCLKLKVWYFSYYIIQAFKVTQAVIMFEFISPVAKSTRNTPYWREMVRLDYANIMLSYIIMMSLWCHYNSLWWAMHNCTELEYLDLSKNKRISGQVPFVTHVQLFFGSLL